MIILADIEITIFKHDYSLASRTSYIHKLNF